MKGLADTTTIRRRLLLTLFLPAVLVLAGGTVADYFATVRPLDEAYDDALIDTAVAIAAHTKRSANGDPELALSQDLRTILRPDARSQTFFRVGLADGTFIAGDEDLPTPSSAANPSLAETVYRGERIRVVAFKTFADGERITVTTGETMKQRDESRRNALLTSVAS